MGLLSASVQGLELETMVYAESRYSDNATSLKQQRRHDIRNTVGLEAQLTEQRRSLDADISVTMEHERYMRETAGDRTAITSGLGMLNLNLVEDFLHWESSYTRIQVLEDASQESGLESRSYRNTLRSGPKITFELTDTTVVDAHAHYVNVENSDAVVSDSERANAGMTFLHHYNQLTRFDLSSQYETILAEDELEQFDRLSVSVGASRVLARGSARVSVGRSRLTPEFGTTTDSNFYQFDFRQEDFLFHSLQLGYSQDVSDTSIGFDNVQLIEPDTGNIPDNDYVMRKRWSGSLGRAIGVHSYVFQVDRSDSRYERSRQQVVYRSASFRYEQPVIAHLVVGASLAYVERDYVTDPTAGVSKSLIYTVDSNYLISDRLSFGSFVRFITRTNQTVRAAEYEEFQLGLDLRYRLF